MKTEGSVVTVSRARTSSWKTIGPLELNQVERVVELRSESETAVPLALFSFASTTMLLSIINAGLITSIPNITVGMAFFYGGLCQFLTCIWDIKCRNPLGALITGSYGTFWMSFGLILIPGSGIISAYPAEEFDSALGLFLLIWMVITLLILFLSIRTNAVFVAMMAVLAATYGCLAFGNMNGNGKAVKAGGYLGIVCACLAYYNAMAAIMSKELTYFGLPVFKLP